MDALLAELRPIRRSLLVLTTLFFVILVVEVDLGHVPSLKSHAMSLALLPVAWLPLSLFALIVVQVRPSHLAVAAGEAAMVIAAVIGLAGALTHLFASGVALDRTDRVFSATVWGGPVSPNWPVAIAIAAILGFIGCYGAGGDDASLRRDPARAICWAAFALIAAGIALSVTPAMLAQSAACLVLAALLLLATLLALLAESALERRPS